MRFVRILCFLFSTVIITSSAWSQATTSLEGHRLQFRAAFNAFNNVNFTNITLDANSPSNFGQFTSAVPARVMQFALRYEF